MKLFSILLFVLFLLGCSNSNNDDTQLRFLWSYEYESPASGLSLVNSTPLVIDNERVVISTDGSIVALDTKDGSRIWRNELPQETELHVVKMLRDENNIYIKLDKTNVAVSYAIDSGNEIWSVNNSGNFDDDIHDAINSTSVFFTGRDPEVFQYSKAGTFEQSFSLGEFGARAVTYNDGTLFISQAWKNSGDEFASGRIIAVDTNTSATVWQYDTNVGGYFNAPLILDGNILFSGTTEGTGQFVALNTQTGEVVWSRENMLTWSFIIIESVIYINDGEAIVALNKNTGAVLWRTNMNSGFGQANLVYLDGQIYHSHGASLNVLNASTGELIHRENIAPDGSPFGNVAVGVDQIYVQSDFNLYCYKAF